MTNFIDLMLYLLPIRLKIDARNDNEIVIRVFCIERAHMQQGSRDCAVEQPVFYVQICFPTL